MAVNKRSVAYWIVTGLLSAMMLMAAGNYFLQHETVVETVERLGYPGFIVYPLAVAKVLGIIAILTKLSATLKEWAYAGFFYDFLLALGGHLNAGDGQWMPPVAALLLLGASYALDKTSLIHTDLQSRSTPATATDS